MSPELKQEIDALLSRAVEMGEVPGVVAMATDRDGPIYQGAFGRRVVGRPTPMTLDTVVWLASMTKALTSAGAMQLVERGVLDLEGPASRWAPELASVPVLEGFDASGKPQLRAAARPITLRHLLTHTAGFGYEIWNPTIGRYMEQAGIPRVGSGRKMAFRVPLAFDPGERWHYGINIDWVGQIIEAVSGQRLGDYLRQHLLAPLGMSDTAFRISPEMRSRLAKIHQRMSGGELQETDIEVTQDPEFEMGGGGLYGTACDYLNFVRMILNRGRSGDAQVLAPRSVDLMGQNHIGDLLVTPLQSVVPERSNHAEFFPGTPKKWGLAYMINTELASTGRSPGSLAWGGLANAYYWIDPLRGIGGVYLTQILPFADAKSLSLFHAFERVVYRALS
jgi:CubicO group peptidase (beta-lactamase class C family)